MGERARPLFRIRRPLFDRPLFEHFYEYTLINGGEAVIGAEATIATTNITEVGYYTHTLRDTVKWQGSYVRCFKATGLAEAIAPAGYDAWATTWGVDIGSSTDDFDDDGLNNYGEYVFGGNPTIKADIGTQPDFVAAGGEYVFSLVD